MGGWQKNLGTETSLIFLSMPDSFQAWIVPAIAGEMKEMDIGKIIKEAMSLPNGEYHVEVYATRNSITFSETLGQNSWTTKREDASYCGDLMGITISEILDMGYTEKDIPDNIDMDDAISMIGENLYNEIMKRVDANMTPEDEIEQAFAKAMNAAEQAYREKITATNKTCTDILEKAKVDADKVYAKGWREATKAYRASIKDALNTVREAEEKLRKGD